MRRTFLIAALAAVLAGSAYAWLSPGPGQEGHGGPIVAVSVPALSAVAEEGRGAFADSCAACHGPDAGGIDGSGPPLVHRIYEPSHHGDASFVLAVRNGVRAHHWPFGDMAPVPGVSDSEIAAIVTYVRELQRANGIF